MARNTHLSLNLPSTGDTARVRSEPWHAVAIRTGRDACCAAEKAAGKRYLTTDAPLLPLQDCDRSGRCECRYRHYPDRRAGPRRKTDGAPPSAPPATDQDERRNYQGRREDDLSPEDEPESARPSLTEGTYYEYVSKLGK